MTTEVYDSLGALYEAAYYRSVTDLSGDACDSLFRCIVNMQNSEGKFISLSNLSSVQMTRMVWEDLLKSIRNYCVADKNVAEVMEIGDALKAWIRQQIKK